MLGLLGTGSGESCLTLTARLKDLTIVSPCHLVQVFDESPRGRIQGRRSPFFVTKEVQCRSWTRKGLFRACRIADLWSCLHSLRVCVCWGRGGLLHISSRQCPCCMRITFWGCSVKNAQRLAGEEDACLRQCSIVKARKALQRKPEYQVMVGRTTSHVQDQTNDRVPRANKFLVWCLVQFT